jgi:hypothetical protein
LLLLAVESSGVDDVFELEGCSSAAGVEAVSFEVESDSVSGSYSADEVDAYSVASSLVELPSDCESCINSYIMLILVAGSTNLP